MSFSVYSPRPPLGEYVDLIWFYQREVGSHPKERLLPTGTMELVVGLEDNGFRPTICGVFSKPFEIETAHPTTVMGVHFRPGGSFPFLGVPASDLQNSRLELEQLWGPHAVNLQEQLLAARSTDRRFRILEHSLAERVRRSPARHPAVSFALREFDSSPPARAVGDVTYKVGLSPRRFIQLFGEQVGLTPKLFCRIARFQSALRMISRTQRVRWAEIALACGYYDQAHLITDFQEFSGLTPSAYLLQRGPHLNHVPCS
jgi:AraC-like DNA-binding protein